MSADLVERVRELISHGRDQGMTMDLVEDVLVALMDADRRAVTQQTIAERFGIALERIAYNNSVHEGAEDPAYWPCNVALTVLKAVENLDFTDR